MANKLLLTPFLLKEIRKLAELGNFDRHIYRKLRIAESTWYSWKQRAKEIEERITSKAIHENDLDSDEKLLLEFLETMEEGRATAIIRNMAQIQRAANTQWTAAKWYLEMVEPDLFGKRETIDLRQIGAIAQTELSEEDADRLREELRAFFPVIKKRKKNAGSDD